MRQAPRAPFFLSARAGEGQRSVRDPERGRRTFSLACRLEASTPKPPAVCWRSGQYGRGWLGGAVAPCQEGWGLALFFLCIRSRVAVVKVVLSAVVAVVVVVVVVQSGCATFRNAEGKADRTLAPWRDHLPQ